MRDRDESPDGLLHDRVHREVGRYRVARAVRLHVAPTYGRPHDMGHGADCWCEPTVTDDGIAVHREEN